MSMKRALLQKMSAHKALFPQPRLNLLVKVHIESASVKTIIWGNITQIYIFTNGVAIITKILKCIAKSFRQK